MNVRQSATCAKRDKEMNNETNTIEQTPAVDVLTDTLNEQVLAELNGETTTQPEVEAAAEQTDAKPEQTDEEKAAAQAITLVLTKTRDSYKVAKVRGILSLAGNQSILAADSTVLSEMPAKQIDAITMELLGVETISKAKDKAGSIKRLIKTAGEKLPEPPVAGAKKARTKAEKPAAPVRTFTAQYDPTDPVQKKLFSELAPQGRACVLAILDVTKEPKEALTATIAAPDLAARLDAHKSLFGDSKAKLRRTFAYYAQTLENQGFLGRQGSNHKRATDSYTYEFKAWAEGEGAPNLSPIAKAVGLLALSGKEEVTLTGAELKAMLLDAKKTGKLVTRRDAFLSFQRVEAEMLQSNVLRVKTDVPAEAAV